ncbi:hypothetical protein K8S19_02990 [bacterium]|nr:hypothetical protein [bacterium]
MHKHLVTLILLVLVVFLPEWVLADPASDKNFLSTLSGKALALDTHRSLLYVGINTGANNLRTLQLDAQGDTTTTWAASSIGSNTVVLGLDAQRNRLYSANNIIGASNEINIITLNNTDGTISSGVGYNTSNSPALCLALDAQRNRLYVGLADTTNGLVVVTLDPSGNFSSSALVTTNRAVHALAIDAARNKLYCGYTSGDVGTCDLDVNGDISVINTPRTIGSNNVTSMALNTFDNTLHVVESPDNNLYTFSLEDNGAGDPGELLASPNTFFVGTTTYCLTLDATRGRLYMGTHSGSADLRWVDLDGSAIPTGSVSTFSGSNLEAIVLDAERQRLYSITSFNSLYYQLTDPSMPAFLIDHGVTTTGSVNVELHWSLPNAHYIRVESSSDLVSYNFPDLATPNMNFDQWYSTGSERWSNDGSNRANTLTVNAVLTAGDGAKTVRIWFAEDAGASNGCSVSHFEERVITLSSGGTATFTPTISPSSTFTPTQTPTYTATLSHTPSVTPSHTPTLSRTPTITMSPTLTPTGTATETETPTHTETATSTVSPTPSDTPDATRTPTPTVSLTDTPTGTATITPSGTQTSTITITVTETPTETHTPVVSATPSATLTATLTITLTNTHSPTITATPSITQTLPPTHTPTPAAVFYLDKNKFIPAREVLTIKVGTLGAGTQAISIYTLNGKRVWYQDVAMTRGGYHYVQWDGRNRQGENVAAGVYFIVHENDGKRTIRKVLVIR